MFTQKIEAVAQKVFVTIFWAPIWLHKGYQSVKNPEEDTPIGLIIIAVATCSLLLMFTGWCVFSWKINLMIFGVYLVIHFYLDYRQHKLEENCRLYGRHT